MLLQWIPTNQQNHVPPANYLFSIWIYSSCIHSNFSFLCYSYRLGDLRVACGWSFATIHYRHTQLHSERLQKTKHNIKKKKMKIHRIIWLGLYSTLSCDTNFASDECFRTILNKFSWTILQSSVNHSRNIDNRRRLSRFLSLNLI